MGCKSCPSFSYDSYKTLHAYQESAQNVTGGANKHATTAR